MTDKTNNPRAVLAAHSDAPLYRLQPIWFESRGMRLFGLGTPSPPSSSPTPIVFLHGASSSHLEFSDGLLPSCAAFAPVLALDRPGYGQSSRRPGMERLGEQAQVIARAIAAYTSQPVIIVAHSMGAAVALRMALDTPDLVAGLVLLAPATRGYPGKPSLTSRLAANHLYGPAFSAVLPKLAAPFIAQASIARVFAPLPVPDGYSALIGLERLTDYGPFRASAADVAASNHEMAAQETRYGDIRCPVRILAGDSDQVLPTGRHSQSLGKRLRDVQITVLPGVGHMPHRAAPELALTMIKSLAADVT